jgi:hypothetical protein
MHLAMGIFWLVGGIGLISWEIYTGSSRLYIRGTEISASWMLPLLALYNFARWWSGRAYQASQQRIAAERATRMREVRYRERPEQPDPNFDFSDKPTAPPGAVQGPGNVTDRPPTP